MREPVLSQELKFSMRHSHISSAGGNATAPFLFVGVLSVPHSRERRDAVRHTWMKDAGPEVAVRFVLYQVGGRPEGMMLPSNTSLKQDEALCRFSLRISNMMDMLPRAALPLLHQRRCTRPHPAGAGVLSDLALRVSIGPIVTARMPLVLLYRRRRQRPPWRSWRRTAT